MDPLRTGSSRMMDADLCESCRETKSSLGTMFELLRTTSLSHLRSQKEIIIVMKQVEQDCFVDGLMNIDLQCNNL